MVYKPDQIVIIEVNDYHLELFSFWYLYLSYFKKNFNFFYPKKLQGLKEKGDRTGGTMGGLFDIDTSSDKFKCLDKLFNEPLISGDILILNSYIDNNNINYRKFIEIINIFSKRYPHLVLVFHGYHKSILKTSEVTNIFNLFKTTTPIFLFPKLDVPNTLIPISNFKTTSLNYQSPIKIGIIGTITPLRDYQSILEIAKLLHIRNQNCDIIPIQFIILGAEPPPIFQQYLNYLVNTVKVLKLHDYIDININVTPRKLRKFINNLHFIAPLNISKDYSENTLTGSIPIAIDNNIPLLITHKICKIYNLNGQLCYYNSLLELLELIINLKDKEYYRLKISLKDIYNKIHIDNICIFKNFLGNINF